jgi:hypothetical protein
MRATRQQTIQAFTAASKPAVRLMASRKRKAAVDGSEQVNPCFVAVVIKKPRVHPITPPETPTKSCKRALATLSLSRSSASLKSSKRKREDSPTAEDIVPKRKHGKREIPWTREEVVYGELAIHLPFALRGWLALNELFLQHLKSNQLFFQEGPEHEGDALIEDVDWLLDDMTRAWEMGPIYLEDLQVLIAVLNKDRKDKLLLIREYACGKVMLEYLPSVLNIFLHGQYDRNLRALWATFVAANEEDEPAMHFLPVLPLEPLVPTSTPVPDGDLYSDRPPMKRPDVRATAPTPVIVDHGELGGSIIVAAAAEVAAARFTRSDTFLYPSYADVLYGNATEQYGKMLTEMVRCRVAVVDPLDLDPPAPLPREHSPPSPEERPPALPILGGPPAPSAAPAPAAAAPVRAAALAERVRAREADSLLNAGPRLTAAERARRAALARAPELLDLLRMMAAAGGAGRASQPLSSVVASVRASLRNPMGKEEVEAGLRALAEEVAPRGVKIMSYGKVSAVVIEPKWFPAAGVVREKLMEKGVVI